MSEDRLSFLFDEASLKQESLATSQVSSNHNYGWRDVALGIQSGSWAIVLTFAVITFFGGKYFGKYFTSYIEKQIALIDSLKENQKTLAENVSDINKTLGNVIKTLEHVASNDKHVGELLNEHGKAILKLMISLDSFVASKETIEARQQEQLKIVKRIDDRLSKGESTEKP